MTETSSGTTTTAPSGRGGPTILMVDDEPNVLDGYRRALRGRFTVVPAVSGEEGLAAVRAAAARGEPFPVIVSDMMMPGMNGAEFLGRARELVPDAVTMLLSGQADLESTIAAVNNGNLFRFLTKPCSADDLARAVATAVEQHRLVQVERELLERTLASAVDVLTELLSLASPEAFERSQQVRTLVTATADRLGVEDWRLPLAAMLSQVGCIAVPANVLHRARSGGDLSDEERAVYTDHPRAAQHLIERIPRLEEVAAWIGDQPVRADAPGGPAGPAGTAGSADTHARAVLHAALAFLVALDATGDPERAMLRLGATGRYPRPLLDALGETAAELQPRGVLREVTVNQLRTGMQLEADVLTLTGMTLVRRGERVTEAVVMRLSNFARTVGVVEPISVLDGV